MKVKVLVVQLCPTLCNLMDYSLPGSSSPGKNTGVGSHFLVKQVFPTQGSNLGLLHCRHILYGLSQLESPLPIFVPTEIQYTEAQFIHHFPGVS